MPPTMANGKICYLEMPAVDIQRSADFYAKVFGWRMRQRGVRRFVGQVLLAGEEAQHRPALAGDVVADRSAQHRIAGFQRLEDRALRDWCLDGELHLAADVRQRSQMLRDYDSDHFGIPFRL